MIELLVVSVLWAFSFGLIKTYLGGVDPNLLAFLRLALASVVFLPLLRLRQPAPALRWRLLLLGSVQFGLVYIAYLASYRYLLAYQVAVFTIFTPFYVMLIHDLLERRLSPRLHLAALLAIGGAAAIVWQEGREPLVWRGILLLQVANLGFAAGQVLYRRIRRDRPELVDHRLIGWMLLGGAAVTLPPAALGARSVRFDLGTAQVLVILYLGLVASGLCFFLWNRGATKVDAGTLGAFNNGYIPLAVAASLLIFGERADPARLLLGAALITGGILLNGRRSFRRHLPASRG